MSFEWLQLLFFNNTLKENDVLETAGAVALYGAAVPYLKIGLAAVVEGIEGTADKFGESGASSQQDGDTAFILFHLSHDPSDGEGLVKILMIEGGLVLIAEPDQVAGNDGDRGIGGFNGRSARAMVEIFIQEQACNEAEEQYAA